MPNTLISRPNKDIHAVRDAKLYLGDARNVALYFSWKHLTWYVTCQGQIVGAFPEKELGGFCPAYLAATTTLHRWNTRVLVADRLKPGRYNVTTTYMVITDTTNHTATYQVARGTLIVQKRGKPFFDSNQAKRVATYTLAQQPDYLELAIKHASIEWPALHWGGGGFSWQEA